MCGIAGIIHDSSSSEERVALVEQMKKKLVHRGPDAEGIVSGEKHCLGHRRLSIIDIEYGNQPMLSENGRYQLVFNGEIYNYLELRQKLIQEGLKFTTFSDTEVLLKLLILKGEAALNELNGIFAFAFYDQKTGEYLLARDHFGIKPLYYSCLPKGGIIFASEIKALLIHPDINAICNTDALYQYISFQFVLGVETLFKGVYKIEPGCLIKGSIGHFTIHRYWDHNYMVDTYHNCEYFNDQLHDLLLDSLRLQIRSDVPLGTYLSGGLDSSIVSSLCAQHLGKKTKTFTGRFVEGESYDESLYAKLVADSIDAEYNEIIPNAYDFVNAIPQLIYMLDEPVAGPGVFPQYCVSKYAAAQVKVILGGQGGDEIFGGYARYIIAYLEQALKGAIFETCEEGKHIVTLENIIPNLPILKQYFPLMQYFFSDGLFEPMDRRYYRLINRMPDFNHIFSSNMLNEFNQEKLFADFQSVFNHPETHSYINKMLHFDGKTLLPALLQIEDRVSMAVSLESRVPLLDHRIVELINRMPVPMKFCGGQTKYILKQVAKNYIPERVLKRKDKMGFPVPLKEWLHAGPVRDFVMDTLMSRACQERGLFNCTELQKTIDNHTVFERQIWGALCLELWYTTFIDNRG